MAVSQRKKKPSKKNATCTICSSHAVHDINSYIRRNPHSIDYVISRFQVDRVDLLRHMDRHMDEHALPDARRYRSMRKKMCSAAIEIIDSRSTDDYAKAVQLLQTADKYLERSRLLSGLQANTTDIVRSPVFRSFCDVVMSALAPFPDAENAVKDALERFES